MGYVAIAPLVIAKDAENRDFFVYQGAPVPEGVTDESIERLLDEGFIVEVEGSDEPSTSWTVKKLVAYAGDHSIDLGEAKKKDEILAAIAAATQSS